MKKYIINLYKALIGKSSRGQVDELLDAQLKLATKTLLKISLLAKTMPIGYIISIANETLQKLLKGDRI